jgi:hypothetical protein
MAITYLGRGFTNSGHTLMWLDRTLIAAPYFCLCVNKKQYKKAMKHLGIPKQDRPEFAFDKDAVVYTFDKPDGSIVCVVCMEIMDKPINQIHGLLVHEAVHIWQKTRDYLNENYPSSEFEAYSIQAISQSLFNAYDKQKEKD